MPNPANLKDVLSEPWRTRAECAKPQNEELLPAWVDEESPNIREAARVCVEECPVRLECAAFAVKPGSDAMGLYGGFFFSRGALASPQARALNKQLGLVARTRQRPLTRPLTNNGAQVDY